MTPGGVFGRIASFFAPKSTIQEAYRAFVALLQTDRLCLEDMSILEDACVGDSFTVSFEKQLKLIRRLPEHVEILARQLAILAPGEHPGLKAAARRLADACSTHYNLPHGDSSPPYTLTLSEAASATSLAGDKASRLGHALLSGHPVPPGFVVTTNAFRAFIEENTLQPAVDALLENIAPGDLVGLDAACRTIRRRIQECSIPGPVSQAIMQAAETLRSDKQKPFTLAVRSSALSEDTMAGFAGQYRSVLHVAPEDILGAYKRVLAGKYLARAVSLRMRTGLADQEAPMAVLVLPMVGGACGGVAYSLDPFLRQGQDVVRVFLTTGSPEGVVDGTMTPEVAVFSREWPPSLIESPNAGEQGLSVWVGKDEALRQTQAVAHMALGLEHLYGKPQDVEWCGEASGKVWLLQTRDLASSIDTTFAEAAPGLPVLYCGGVQASPGLASGVAFHLDKIADVPRVPDDSILLARSLWPELAPLLSRVKGVISETGSQAGHLASLARSFGVPVLAAASGSMALIAPGTPLTLDVGTRTVHAGLADTAQLHRNLSVGVASSVAVARLKDALERITPLHLKYPDADEFTPKAVRTIHDMVRFCHEMAVRAMFNLSEIGRAKEARHASLGIPLDMSILDLGGGLVGQDLDSGVTPTAHFGPLLQALCVGLEHPRATWSAAPHFDWDKLSLSLEGGIVPASEARLSAYAIVSAEHVHFLARFGFHFAVLDCHTGQVSDQSYVNFSFNGGGGAKGGRLARQGLLSWILEREGFTVTTRGELLTASLSMPDRPQVLRSLSLLGFILARTLSLDMAEGGSAFDAAAQDILDVAQSLGERNPLANNSLKGRPPDHDS